MKLTEPHSTGFASRADIVPYTSCHTLSNLRFTAPVAPETLVVFFLKIGKSRDYPC